MNFFNENNLIFVALNKIGDIILANLLFILCSIPLVTIGPSLTALYHCMLRTVKGNNNGTVNIFPGISSVIPAVSDRLAGSGSGRTAAVSRHPFSFTDRF
mgnify:CR=1 FL=1